MLRAAALVLPLFIASCSGAATTPAADRPSAAQAQPAKALPTSIAQPGDPQAGTQVTGTVAETMDAASYTYVRLNTSSGEIWAAVTQTTLTTGSPVTIGNGNWMEGFESQTLNRRFDRIFFGSLMTQGAATRLPADGAETRIEKAPGKDGRTVAEIHASKATLKGKEVAVRGRVIKFNADILGRNWIHLRDGSGSADKQDNDITVTTAEAVTKGDIVLMRGKLALDKDFSAGYVYPVIIEDAKVVK